MELHLRHPHSWDLLPDEASAVQQRLRQHVVIAPLSAAGLRRVAGIDASFSGSDLIVAVVIVDFATQRPLERVSARSPVTYPYVPGLLSFREAPGILAALARLSSLPDVLMVDGQGLAHPRRFGIACHLGVLLDLPAIGCAKSILTGHPAPLATAAGSLAELVAEDKEVVGMAVRTRAGVKPVFVSVGHRVDLASAVQVVYACARGYRLPEPTRLAHNFAAELRRG
jgi:deoxyribonuclease V